MANGITTAAFAAVPLNDRYNDLRSKEKAYKEAIQAFAADMPDGSVRVFTGLKIAFVKQNGRFTELPAEVLP